MSQSIIDTLKEALKFSPENVHLKLHLAETLFSLDRIEEAEQEFLQALALQNNEKGLMGLARVYFKKEDYSTCNVILEDLLKKNPDNLDVLILYAKSSLQEKALTTAIETYKKILEIDPSFKDEELDGELRIGAQYDTEYKGEDEEEMSLFIQKPDID